MKRTIYLLRHAKSDWDADYDEDWERPLNQRGKRAVKALGDWWRSQPTPEVVCVSHAVRTQQTLEGIARLAEWDINPKVCPALYGGDVDDYIHTVEGISASLSSALIVGHEPGMSSYLEWITGTYDVRFPTAALAILRLYGEDWKSSQGSKHAILRGLLTPKFLGVR